MLAIDALNQFAQKWFDTIAAQSIYAAIMAAFVWSVLKLARGKHPVWAIALWSLVLIRFVMPVDSAAPWTARTFFERTSQSWLMQDYPKIQAAQRPLLENEGRAQSVLPESTSLPINLANSSVVSDPALFDWQTLLFAVWVLGAGLCLARLLRAYKNLSDILSRAVPIATEPLAQAVLEWRAALGVRRSVRLLSSSQCDGAFTCHVFKPIIVLPEELVVQMDYQDLSAIIGHEMAHIRGLDSFWLTLEQILRALFFFHPAVWIATSKLDEAREALRDLDMLSAGQVTPTSYAGTLLSVLKNQRGAAPAPIVAVAMGRTAARLKQRLLLMRQAAVLIRPSRWLLALSTLTIAVIILPMSHSIATKAQPSKLTNISVPRATAQATQVDAEDKTDPAQDGWSDQNATEMAMVETVDNAQNWLPVAVPEAPKPPVPAVPPVSWIYEDITQAPAEIDESLREAAQDLTEAQTEYDAALKGPREDRADASEHLRIAQSNIQHIQRDAAKANSDIKKAIQNPSNSLNTMIVFDGTEIRCGSKINTAKDHSIFVNNKLASCTGSLTLSDVEGKTRRSAQAVVFLENKGVVKIVRNGKDLFVYSVSHSTTPTTVINTYNTGALNETVRARNAERAAAQAEQEAARAEIKAEAAAARAEALAEGRAARAEAQSARSEARSEALASLAEASVTLREQRTSLRQNLRNSGLATKRITEIMKSIDQSLANVEQQRSVLQRELQMEQKPCCTKR